MSGFARLHGLTFASPVVHRAVQAAGDRQIGALVGVACFVDLKCVDEKNLLWFHHLPWDYRLKSGDTLWDGLVKPYGRGVSYVDGMEKTWASLAPYVDAERHAEVADYLKIQRNEAQWWRDASVAWFGSFSRRPLPAGEKTPVKSLQYYESLEFPWAPGNGQ